MKKIIVGILSFVFLFTGIQSVSAAGPFNGDPNDCNPGMGIGVYPNNIPRDSYGCWSATYIEANAGDTINVAMYYRNNTKNPLTNVRGSISAPSTTASDSFTFTGTMYSDQGNTTVGRVTVKLSSSQKLAYSSTHWMKDAAAVKSDTDTSVFNNNGGQISIGTVPPGWDNYGEFLAVFKVGNAVAPEICKDATATNYGGALPCTYPPQVCKDTSATNYGGALPCTYPPQVCTDPNALNYGGALPCQPKPVDTCKINNFTANRLTIQSGSTSDLSWTTSNCNSVSISSVGTVNNSGVYTVRPTTSMTYTLSAYGTNSQDSESIMVTVNQTQPKVMTGYLTASPVSCTIPKNSSSCEVSLNWNTTNPVSTSLVTLIDRTVIYSGNSGTKNISVTNGSKTYYFENNGVPLDEERVSASCATGSKWSGTYCAPDIDPEPLVMRGSISASPSSCTIPKNESTCSTVLSWNTVNPKGISTVTKPVNQTVATGNSDSKTVTISYGTTNFYLYNSNVELASTSASASCASGSEWLGSYCAPTTNPTCTINSFIASPTSLNKGSTSTLSWSTSNCTSLNISGESVGATGNKTVYPQNTTSYVLSASGSNGSDSEVVNVTVNENNQTNNCSLTSFTVNGRTTDTVDYKEKTTLSWTSNYCTSVSISPYVSNNLNVNDSEDIYPTSTTTYVIKALGNNGSDDSRTVKVNVNDDEDDSNYCIIRDFSVDDTQIEYGDETNIEWETEGCDRVSLSTFGNVSRSGEREISPQRGTKYELAAYTADGFKQTKSLYVNVIPRNNNNNDYCTINNFSANQSYINSGAQVVLNWNTTGCSSANISYVGPVSNSGTRPVYPTVTTNYILTAYSPKGENVVRNVSVVVNSNIVNPPIIIPVSNTCAVTTVATNITGSSATLNGFIASSGSGNGYFEYGPTTSLGSRTQSRFVSNGTSFSENISGLSANRIYYFRFVSDCNGGNGFGVMDVFRTLGSSVVRPVVYTGTTVVGQASPIMLKIENRYEAIGKGDTIEYTVTYKNIGKSTLRNPILQVIVPEGITIRNASRGTYQEDTRTLTVELDDLAGGEEGVLYVQGYVVSIQESMAKIVSTALLVYTNTNGSQENAIAYVLNIPKQLFSNGNVLGASAFFSGLFGGDCNLGLIGWLLLLILILLIILIIRRYFYTPRHNHTNPVYPPSYPPNYPPNYPQNGTH